MIDASALKGIIPPLVTPFEADGLTVRERGVHQLVDWLIGQGAHGIFIGGTTGEVWVLDDAQWARLTRFAVQATAGRAPVLAGVSAPSTAAAVARARTAEALGADAVVSLAPYYTPPSQRDIVRHFEALSNAVGLPIVVYQFPGIVKTSITIPTYERLARIPRVVALKDSQADVTEFRSMIAALRGGGHDFRLFLGTDTLTDVCVLMGGQGTVPSLGNVTARMLAESYTAAVAGNWARSADAQARSTAVKRIYAVPDSDSIFVRIASSVKCALGLLGVEAGPPAAPIPPCTAEQTRAIEAILGEGGLLG